MTEQAHTESVFSAVCSHSVDHGAIEAEEKHPESCHSGLSGKTNAPED
jgi:hypothetical protein